VILEPGIAARRSELSADKQALLERRMLGALKTSKKALHIPRRAESRKAPLPFARQRPWFFSQLESNSPLYYLPIAVRLSGWLDRDALERSLSAIVEHSKVMLAPVPCGIMSVLSGGNGGESGVISIVQKLVPGVVDVTENTAGPAIMATGDVALIVQGLEIPSLIICKYKAQVMNRSVATSFDWIVN
jgi:hypothetical protein